MNYRFSEVEAAALMDAAVTQALESALDMRDESAVLGESVAAFRLWCRIIGELHQPTTFPAVVSPFHVSSLEPAPVDGIDPRAFAPHCIHGRPFTVPCDTCDRNTAEMAAAAPAAPANGGDGLETDY